MFRLSIRAALALLLLLLPTATAQAQTPGDVANQISTIAVEVITLDRVPWVVGVQASGSLDSGEADASSFRTTGFAIRETQRLTFGGLASVARQSSQKQLDYERYSINLAAAYALSSRWYLMGIEQWNRAPFNLLDNQNVVAGLLIYEIPFRSALQMGVFGGFGYTDEELTIDPPPGVDTTFGTVQVGLGGRYPLRGGNGLTMSASWGGQLGRMDNYVIGSQVAVDTRLVGVLGLQSSYAIAYDHEPYAGREGMNQSFSVAVTLTLIGQPPKKP